MNILFVVVNDNQWSIFKPIVTYMHGNASYTRPIVLLLTNYFEKSATNRKISIYLDKIGVEYASIQRRENILIWECNVYKRWRILTTEVSWQLDKILRFWKPAVIILPSDCTEIAKMVIWKAKMSCVLTLLIQDGILFPKDPPWALLFSFRHMDVKKALREILNKIFTVLGRPYFFQSRYGHGGCDKILVLGRYYKCLLLKESISNDRIIVTGSPKYEMLLKQYKYLRSNILAKTEIRKGLKVMPKAVIVVYFSTNYYTATKSRREQNLQLINIKDISRSIAKLGREYILLVKIHPKEKIQEYKQFCRQNFLNNVKVVKNQDNLEIIHVSSVIITVSSTMMFEAMLCKKPVLLAYYNWQVPTRVRHQTAELKKIEDVFDIAQMIYRVLHDKVYAEEILASQMRFLRNHVENVNSSNIVQEIVAYILGIAKDTY